KAVDKIGADVAEPLCTPPRAWIMWATNRVKPPSKYVFPIHHPPVQSFGEAEPVNRADEIHRLSNVFKPLHVIPRRISLSSLQKPDEFWVDTQQLRTGTWW